MGKSQSVRKSLPRRVAMATGAGLLAVVAGFGMAPAGADDKVKAEAEVSVEWDDAFGNKYAVEVGAAR